MSVTQGCDYCAGGGFVGIPSEWWHFELPQAASYPLLADQFTCFISPGTQHAS
nr:M15 family metallopeptidase [Escherichia coli]